MKIAPAQQENFIKNPKECRSFLIYGPDEGQIRLQSQKLIQQFLGNKYDPMSLTEITPESLSEEPSRLSDELGSFSLLGGDRLVLFRNAGASDAKIIQSALLEGSAPVWPLIVLGGDLRPTSALRKLFEKETALAALACYQDDARKVTQLLSEGLRERGITCEQGVIAMLAETLGNDRAITLQEIDKIDLYLNEERELTTETARMLCGDNRDHRMDELFNAVCGGTSGLEDTLSRCFKENIQPIGIYRMLSGHFTKLLSIKSMIAGGAAPKAAFARHGVFFKQEAGISHQIRYWNEPALRRAIAVILQAERAAKQGTVTPEAHCRELLHKLARHAASSNHKRAA